MGTWNVPHSMAKVGVPGYVRCKRVRRPFTSTRVRYIVWGNTRVRYILWAGYIYAWFVHGLIWVDPDRAYIMHARADESTERNRLGYYFTFYATSVPLNCAHNECVTRHHASCNTTCDARWGFADCGLRITVTAMTADYAASSPCNWCASGARHSMGWRAANVYSA